jgi:hypothetical protein
MKHEKITEYKLRALSKTMCVIRGAKIRRRQAKSKCYAERFRSRA